MKKESKVKKIRSLLLFLFIFGSILLFSLPEVNNIRGQILEDEIAEDSVKFSRILKDSVLSVPETDVVQLINFCI